MTSSLSQLLPSENENEVKEGSGKGSCLKKEEPPRCFLILPLGFLIPLSLYSFMVSPAH